MEKRWAFFLFVTLLIYIVFIGMINKNAQRIKEQRQEEEQSLSESSAPEISSSDSSSTSTLAKIKAAPVPSAQATAPPQPYQKEDIITVDTRLYHVELTSRGGRPLRWDMLVENSSDTDQKTSHSLRLIEIIGDEQDRELPLEIDFREYNSVKSYHILNRMIFEYDKKVLENGDIEIIFTSPPVEEIYITKRYLFKADSHLTDLSVSMHNTTGNDIIIDDGGKGLGISWGPGLGLLQNIADSYEKRFAKNIYCLEKGGADKFNPSDKSQEISDTLLWGGHNTRFLLAAIIPLEQKAVNFQSAVKTKNTMDAEGKKLALSIPPSTATLWLPKTTLPANGSRSFNFNLFVGPRMYSLLKDYGHNLEASMFYTHMGWVRALCIILLFTLHWLFGLLNNFGLAIIGLTILVRVVTYPLTHKGMKLQAKAMAEQAKLRPFIQEINEKYASNPQLKNKKMMELYKEHGINPLGFLRGCLPLFIQMPIFISLYYLLSESFELRGAGFLWIKDLSAPDRLVNLGITLPVIGNYLNLLPLLMGVSQIFVSKFTSSVSADPNQKTMMYFFPIFFMFIVYNLSSGLVLYWLISNLLQAGQQFIINKNMKKEKGGTG
ncbi:YidC/Oxa1 family insertase periplasmic-domain containing protein [Candidatus Sumerlaeota bacterium]|nr:YidC/Oxa1 family insertase periplasmic-domain containing protein [Candidatus Sumerlaeota bacterium]